VAAGRVRGNSGSRFDSVGAANDDREPTDSELTPNKPKSLSETRLVEVLDAYLAAAQEGGAATRDELLARHPEIAENLEGVSGHPGVHPPGLADCAAARGRSGVHRRP
jgi:hypothetical protein